MLKAFCKYNGNDVFSDTRTFMGEYEVLCRKLLGGKMGAEPIVKFFELVGNPANAVPMVFEGQFALFWEKPGKGHVEHTYHYLYGGTDGWRLQISIWEKSHKPCFFLDCSLSCFPDFYVDSFFSCVKTMTPEIETTLIRSAENECIFSISVEGIEKLYDDHTQAALSMTSFNEYYKVFNTMTREEQVICRKLFKLKDFSSFLKGTKNLNTLEFGDVHDCETFRIKFMPIVSIQGGDFDWNQNDQYRSSRTIQCICKCCKLVFLQVSSRFFCVEEESELFAPINYQAMVKVAIRLYMYHEIFCAKPKKITNFKLMKLPNHSERKSEMLRLATLCEQMTSTQETNGFNAKLFSRTIDAREVYNFGVFLDSSLQKKMTNLKRY
jgi:hypothetical protein